MKEYHKIETVYERDMAGSKKLIEGLFHNEAVDFLANNIWIFTEKIDGANIRVHWDGHNVEFAGRMDKTEIPNKLLYKLEEIFCNNETEELFEQIFGDKDVILFGEGYGSKIQKVGSLYREDVGFILFDVMIGDNFLSRDNVESIARTFNLEVVPIIMRGTIDEAVGFVKRKPKSRIGTAPMEGLVGRPSVELKDRSGERIIVKIKARDFE